MMNSGAILVPFQRIPVIPVPFLQILVDSGQNLWGTKKYSMDVRSISTSAIISFAHTLRMVTSTSSTLLELSILPTFSPNRLVMSSSKSTLHGLVWALAEGVCWESSRDSIKRPFGHSSLLLWRRIFMTAFSTSLIHEQTSQGQAPIFLLLI
jgi:hypothetical protein